MATNDRSLGTSATALVHSLGSADHPLVLDVRRDPAFQASPHLMCGSLHRSPAMVEQDTADFPAWNRIVVVCVHGHEVSQDAAATLRACGYNATHLIDGIEGWIAAGLPTLRKSATYDGTKPTRWVTRARPKIDRIACPWLVRRFVDPLAEFHYVSAPDVLAMSEKLHAIPFDIPGVDFSHHGDHCSFDSMIERFSLTDPALLRLADIVRGADTSRLELTAQSAGLYAISLGLSDLIEEDHALLDAGMKLYDALYRWQRDLTGEAHAWPPKDAAVLEAAR
jgi:rhodanese-related sulfurtransferase